MPQGSISSSRDAVGVAVVNYQAPVVETRGQVETLTRDADSPELAATPDIPAPPRAAKIVPDTAARGREREKVAER